ncbi:MAG: o-succinylbenzoate synthase, partial [Gammaproteobacteria bacterium]|nr:o-succinylbenzoate synthase [Gammaproteobacteria bacterium]
QARKAGMGVVVTSTIDSAVGVWAATHLAAALGKKCEPVAHGLATSHWLASDVAEPPAIREGLIHLPC